MEKCAAHTPSKTQGFRLTCTHTNTHSKNHDIMRAVTVWRPYFHMNCPEQDLLLLQRIRANNRDTHFYSETQLTPESRSVELSCSVHYHVFILINYRISYRLSLCTFSPYLRLVASALPVHLNNSLTARSSFSGEPRANQSNAKGSAKSLKQKAVQL